MVQAQKICQYTFFQSDYWKNYAGPTGSRHTILETLIRGDKNFDA
jgi:hypothetical protein